MTALCNKKFRLWYGMYCTNFRLYVKKNPTKYINLPTKAHGTSKERQKTHDYYDYVPYSYYFLSTESLFLWQHFSWLLLVGASYEICLRRQEQRKIVLSSGQSWKFNSCRCNICVLCHILLSCQFSTTLLPTRMFLA